MTEISAMKLCEKLAQIWFDEKYEGTDKDLTDTHWEEGIGFVSMIKPEYASEFFDRTKFYWGIVENYIEDATNQKRIYN